MASLLLDDVRKNTDRNTRAIEKIVNFLFGDGEQGMDETIRDIQSKLDTLSRDFNEKFDKLSKEFEFYKVEQQKEKDYQIKKRDSVQLVIIGALITNGLALIGTVIYWMIRVYPLIHQLESQLGG